MNFNHQQAEAKHTCKAAELPFNSNQSLGHIQWRASLAAQLVKNPPAVWETWVAKIPWRREWVATHSSILAWRIPWTIYSPWGHKELDTTEQIK